MTKVLVTGGAGFIASSSIEKLLNNKDYFIVAVDNFLTGNNQNCFKNLNYLFIKADVNDFNSMSAIMLSHKFDFIFHFSAVVGVIRTTENPSLVINDINGFQNIFMLAKNTGVKRIYFSSSSEVYGEPVEIPLNEFSTPLNSRLPYAVVKNIGECFCRTFSKEFKLDYTILRFFNTYGPKQSNDFVISEFIEMAIKGDDLLIYGNGLQTRTFCYIDDNIDTIIKIFDNNLHINDTINIGSHVINTIKETAEIIIKKTNSRSKIVHIDPLTEGDMTRRQPDNSKMLVILNWPLISLEEGIGKILNLRYEFS